MLWHNFLAFFPGATSSTAPIRSKLLEISVFKSPLSIFFAGDLAVYVFFVLSGFVISIGHFRNPVPENLRRSFFRRYVRLMPTAFASVIAAFMLLKLGWFFNHQASEITHSWWLPIHWTSTPTELPVAIWSGLYGMWFGGFDPGSAYNSNLGTLAIELVGSIAVFATLLLMQVFYVTLRFRICIYFLLICECIAVSPTDPHYIIFFFGMILADLYCNAPRFFGQSNVRGIVIFAIGVFFGSENISNINMPYYEPLTRFYDYFDVHPLTYSWALSSILLLLGVLCAPALQRVFCLSVFRVLGDYSFALFVCHTIVLGSATCWVFLWLSDHWAADYRAVVAIAFAATLPLLAAATIALRHVDLWSIKLSRSL